jgi:IPT/TIG domain
MFGKSGIILLLELICLFTAVSGEAQVSVLTQHNDNARTGQNLNETLLNTTNVNVSGFGKLFWRTIDGQPFAQPLYVSGLSIGGKTRNVVYVATEHNSVYAFDADDPNQALPLWQVNLGTPVPSQDICVITGDTEPQDCPYVNINTEIGITGTPVIDSVAGIIYVVARTKTGANSYHFVLHALSIKTGAEQLGGPVEITGQVTGSGTASSGGILAFDPTFHLQRPGLLLMNNVVYVSFGAIGDIGQTFHGWIMGYDTTSLQRVALSNVTPNGNDGGIWQSGQGLVGDGSGNLYMITGNGTFDADSGGKDYGDSMVKMSTSSGLAVTDYFTPSNQSTLALHDTDFGAGGPMLIPGTSLMVGMGKDKMFRVVDTTNMGKFNANMDNVVQEFTGSTNAYLGSPIYWDSPNNGPVIYLWGPTQPLSAYKLVGGKFQTTPVMQSTIVNSTGFANTAPLSLSANDGLVGSGIVWGTTAFSATSSRVPVAGIVRAFDATNLGSELWDSRQNAARDDVGTYAKWVPPTVANGKVYVPNFSGQLVVYGLNPPPASGIHFVQVAAGTPGTSTASVTVAYPAAELVGDLNVVAVSWSDTTSTIQSVTDSKGNVYTRAIGPTTGTGLRQSIYYAKNVPAGSNSVTVAFNQAAASPDIRIVEYSGIDTANPLDVSIAAAGSTSIADSGSISVTNANDLIFGANIVNSPNVAPGSPLTTRILTSTNSNIVEDRFVNVVGSYHAWAPLVTAAPWVMQMVAFKAKATSTNPAPTVTSIAPNNGPSTGGTAVTITGTGFLTGATVTLGGTPATGVVVATATSITAITAAHTVGAVNVVVTNTDGQSFSLTNGYSYTPVNPAPTVTSVTPNNGLTTGGNAVTIAGTGFLAGATVSFGGTPATGVTVVSATSITATAPAHAAGAVNVAVTNSDGQSFSLTNGYTYNPGAGGGTIRFVQVVAAVPQTGSMSVPVTFPVAQTAGNLNVVAVGWDDTASSITSVADNRGNVYTLAVGPINGTGERESIYYAKNIAGGSTTITVTFDHAAVFVDLRALEYSGLDTANPLDVTAQAAGAGASANSGSATTTSASELIFGAGKTSGRFTAAGTGFTSRVITSPDGDIAEDKIVNATGSNNAVATGTSSNWVMQMATFRAQQGIINPAPTVTSVTPNNGPITGGNAVTIAGTGFLAGATVSFSGTAATGVTVVSATSITATAPAHAAGAVNVAVTNTDSQSFSLTNGYTYKTVNPAPTVTSVTPNNGPTTGGNAVTIAGTGFLAGATVSFSGTAATGVTVVSATSITATAPAHAAGAVNVAVTNSDAQSNSLTNGYTYNAATGGGPIRFVQVASAVPQTGSMSVPVTFPVAQTAGNLNVVAVGWDDTASSVTSVTDNRGNVYTLAVGPINGTGERESIYYAKNITGGSTTVTVTFDHAAVFVDLRALEYGGLDTANPLDVTAQAAGAGASANSGSATTTSASELIFGAGKTSGRFTAAGTGFTSRVITSPDGDIAEDKIVNATGSNNAVATGTSSNWVMQMATFRAQ